MVHRYVDTNFHGKERLKQLVGQVSGVYRRQWADQETRRLIEDGRMTANEADALKASVEQYIGPRLPRTSLDLAVAAELLPQVREEGEVKASASWGLLGTIGLDRWLVPIDDSTRTPFAPYGLSGIMLGASIVFFAFIGFDSISTHAEEARRPQRDVPIGILVSLSLCTVLYILVASVVTGMERYPDIDTGAPIAAAFTHRAAEAGAFASVAGALIAIGGLAGMTSVLLVLFLSQARIFMAMSRDGLLPQIFGTVHPKFCTPHVATIVTGVVICITAAFTPIYKLEEMVNVGTLLAFVMVCAAVLILRVQRPAAHRPFRCPALAIVGPLGILVNLALMLFLPIDTWLRLLIWLGLGLAIYFLYSRSHSLLTRHLLHEVQMPREEKTGTKFDPEEVGGD
jgi:APA family basic amino acid/polyamine antiporter